MSGLGGHGEVKQPQFLTDDQLDKALGEAESQEEKNRILGEMDKRKKAAELKTKIDAYNNKRNGEIADRVANMGREATILTTPSGEAAATAKTASTQGTILTIK